MLYNIYFYNKNPFEQIIKNHLNGQLNHVVKNNIDIMKVKQTVEVKRLLSKQIKIEGKKLLT